MFRWISLISFAVVIAALVIHYLVYPCGYKPRFSADSLIRKTVHLFTLLFPPQKLSLPGKLRKLVFLLAMLSFVILLLTGFAPVLFGSKLQGYWLMLHATFAPVFIGCAAVIALLGAGQYRFNKTDCSAIPCRCGRSEKVSGCWLTDTGIGVKAGFWLLLIVSLPVTLTMVVSMLPWFGTEGQDFLYHAHRWSALAFGLIAIAELYMLIRMGIREEFD
jgi:hypothetical protein